MITLAPYQVEARDWLLANRKAILGDAPGVGKIYPAIEAALASPGPRLFVVPAYLMGQWEQYIRDIDELQSTVAVVGTPKQKRKALLATYDNYIVTYGLLSAVSHRNRLATHRYPDLIRDWPTVVCDEAHRFRGRNSKCTKVATKLAVRAHRWWMLTGTPIYNNAGDMWTLLRMCDPKYSSYWRFVKKHCNLTVNPWTTLVGDVIDPDAFNAEVSDYMLRRTTEDVGLALPPARYYDVRVSLTKSVLKTPRDRS